MSSIIASSVLQDQPFPEADSAQTTQSQTCLFKKQKSIASRLPGFPSLRSQSSSQKYHLNKEALVKNPFNLSSKEKQLNVEVEQKKVTSLNRSTQKIIEGRQLPSLNLQSASNHLHQFNKDYLQKCSFDFRCLDKNSIKMGKRPANQSTGLIISIAQQPAYKSGCSSNQKIKVDPKTSMALVKESGRRNSRKLMTREATELSSSEEQYDSDATPGPGQYEVRLPGKQEMRSKKQSIQQIFYSKSKRFKVHLEDQSQPKTLVEQTNSVSQGGKGKGFFLSRLPKFDGAARQNNPPPGHYNTRQSLEYELVRNILKSSNSSFFVNSCQRSLKLQRNDYPGPGSYSLQGNQSDIHQYQYMFKSTIPKTQTASRDPSSLFSQQSLISLNGDREASLIHVKTDYVLQDNSNCQSPPFLSSSERFPLPLRTEEKRYYHQIRRSPQKERPSFAPFNSSSKRELQLPNGSGVGVGLYSSFLGDKWKGNSFNASCS